MDRSPLLDSHALSGARIGARPEAPDHDAVLTFGDVPAEYRAARTGAALFDVSDRSRVTVKGSERASFLHRILANDVLGLEPGSGNRNLLLTPKGKVTLLGDLSSLEEEFEFSLPPGWEARALSAIDMFLFSEDVQLEGSGDEHAPLELVGPQSRAVLSKAVSLALPEDLPDHASIAAPDGVRVERLAVAGIPGWRVDAGPSAIGALYARLVEAGAVPAGVVVRDILRVETGSALFGVDVDENVYPAEAGLDDAFSLEKGCYVGQEVVAKIDTYGGLNKRLLRLAVDHDDPIPRGTRLLSDDGERRELGLVTSWAYSFELDNGALLAYVKRRHQEPGTAFVLSLEGRELGRASVR
ncbi:MAG TPA: aminomethyl transferase family protein [Planctomycetes bacterium]|nr:aminomethyl transferase family protein [Planctomycetota bacterium]